MNKTIRFSKDRSKNVAALAKELDWWYDNMIVGDKPFGCKPDECWIPVGPKLYWDVLRNFEWYEKQLSSKYKIREYGGDEPLYYYRQKARLCFKFL